MRRRNVHHHLRKTFNIHNIVYTLCTVVCVSLQTPRREGLFTQQNNSIDMDGITVVYILIFVKTIHIFKSSHDVIVILESYILFSIIIL